MAKAMQQGRRPSASQKCPRGLSNSIPAWDSTNGARNARSPRQRCGAVRKFDPPQMRDALSRIQEPARPDTGPQEALQEDVDSFVWRENWYPVANVSYLNRKKPSQIVILNEEIVVWFGEDQRWHAAADRCPHKLAPLSEGRLDNNVLECRYHGWRFSGDGTCQFSPQTSAVPRACLSVFPTEEAQGILWVWPQSGAAAQTRARNKALPLYEDASQPSQMSADSDFFYLHCLMDWHLALENFLDPSHAPCLHEGITGNRKDMVHMWMEVPQIHPTQGIRAEHGSYTKMQQSMQMVANREWIPPCQTRSEYAFGSGIKHLFVLYITPEAPGSCHVFGKFFLGAAKEAYALAPALKPNGSPTMQWTQRIKALGKKMVTRIENLIYLCPDIPMHTAFQELSNQDLLVFTHSEHLMKRSEASKQASDLKTPSRLSAESYHLSSLADQGTSALWQWVDKFGGEPDWSRQRPLKHHFIKDRKTLFSHYERHTKHCPKCLCALGRLEQVANYLKGAMLVVLTVALIPESTLIRATLVLLAGVLQLARNWALGKQVAFHGYTLLPDEKGVATAID